jgi:hypothetical protein
MRGERVLAETSSPTRNADVASATNPAKKSRSPKPQRAAKGS